MQIKTLEDYLRVPLLRREGRTVELTSEGARLLPPCRAAPARARGCDRRARARIAAPASSRSRRCRDFCSNGCCRGCRTFRRVTRHRVRLHTADAVGRPAAVADPGGGPARQGQMAGAARREAARRMARAGLQAANCSSVTAGRARRGSAALPSGQQPWWPWSVWITSGRSSASSAARRHVRRFGDRLRAAESGQGLALARWSLAASDSTRDGWCWRAGCGPVRVGLLFRLPAGLPRTSRKSRFSGRWISAPRRAIQPAEGR